MEQQQQQSEKTTAEHVLKTPLWVVLIRGLQFLVTLVILGLTAWLIHDAYLDEEGFALAMCIITWLMLAYIVLSEKIPSFRPAYHIVAVIVLDGLLVVLWLACFAAVAAKRAKYRVRVQVSGCFDDGSFADSKTCFRKRAEDVIFFKTGLAAFAAIAGLGALVWVLFVVTFVWTMVQFFNLRKEGRFRFGSGMTQGNNYQMEPKVETQPMTAQPMATQPMVAQQPQPGGQFPQQQQPQPQYQQPIPGQYPVQDEYPPQSQAPYSQPQSPYQQQPPVSPPPQGAYPVQEQQFQGQPQQQQVYGQYAPQQQPTGHGAVPPSPYGSELVGEGAQQGYPPVVTNSPPAPQEMQSYPPYHHQG